LNIETFPHPAIGRRSVKEIKKRGEFLNNLAYRWRMCEILHDISKIYLEVDCLNDWLVIPPTGNYSNCGTIIWKDEIHLQYVMDKYITLDKQTVFSLD
jgi:hypothetical protein